MPENTIHNPHDKIVKTTLTNIALAKKFFAAHLPPSVKKEIKLNTLQLQKGSFVDKELKEYLTDLLYTVKIGKRPGYLYLLLESQSKVDDLMAFRLMQYSVKIMAQHLKLNKTKKLPIIYPMVYFVGKPTRKQFKTDIFQCFDNATLAKKYFLKPFNLIDLSKLPDNKLLRDKTLAGLELLQKHVYTRDLAQVLDTMLEKGVFVAMQEHDGEYLYSVLKYLVNIGEIKQPEQFFEKLGQQFPGDKKIMTIAQYYEKKGLKQGVQKGIEQGMEAVAKNLLAMGDDPARVAKATGLPEEKIEALNTIH